MEHGDGEVGRRVEEVIGEVGVSVPEEVVVVGSAMRPARHDDVAESVVSEVDDGAELDEGRAQH